MSRLRKVTKAELSHNAGNSGTRWILTLECGHRACRHRQAGQGNRNWKTYPQPKQVFCKKCK